MVLYEIADGEYLGFYREYGGPVEITGYRDRVVREWVIKDRPIIVKEDATYQDVEVWIPEVTVEEWVLVPEHVEIHSRIVDGEWIHSEQWIEGEWVDRRYWIEEDCWYEPHTEIRPVLGEMVGVTRNVLVCEPAHWGERKEWIDGYWKAVSEWVDAHDEEYEVMVRTHYEKQDVTYPGHYETETVLVPGEYVTVMAESGAWEDVIYQEPIFSYVGAKDEYCLEGHKKALIDPAIGEPDLDELLLRKTATNERITVPAQFVKVAKSIGPNNYIV